jgi:V8-like Glu-specific endopeptidase
MLRPHKRKPAVKFSIHPLLWLVWPILVRAALTVGHPTEVEPNTDASRNTNPATTGNRDRALIVGGVRAKKGAYLWYGIPSSMTLCAASLIHSDIMVTAAHCDSEFPISASIMLGGIRRDGADAKEVNPMQAKRRHPDYAQNIQPEYANVTEYLRNDIMLIKLQRPSTAAVVPLNKDSLQPKSGEALTVIGYGDMVPGTEPSPSPILLQTSLLTFGMSRCQALYDGPLVDNPSGGRIVEPAQHFCTWASGTGSCGGDSGGPLLAQNGLLVGITSFNLGCADDAYPNVEVRISAMRDFIQRGICELSSHPPEHCTNAQTRAIDTVVACRGTQWRLPLMERKQAAAAFERAYNAAFNGMAWPLSNVTLRRRPALPTASWPIRIPSSLATLFFSGTQPVNPTTAGLYATPVMENRFPELGRQLAAHLRDTKLRVFARVKTCTVKSIKVEK